MNGKSLVCITTCNRVAAVRALVWDYVEFCANSHQFDLLVSLDGDDPKTVRYCDRHGIPLLYSVECEGVGLSKNRVLKSFPDYDSYFFVEDDVALLDPGLFSLHIKLARASGIPHFSLFPEDRLVDEQASSDVCGYRIRHAWYGSAQINFFTQDGIRQVGGFDTRFARYRRFGHTEHSCRFVNAGLSRYPFNLIDTCLSGYVRWFEPGSVTRVKVSRTEKRLFRGEADLISEKAKWAPVATLSEFAVPTRLDLDGTRADRLRAIYRSCFCIQVAILDQIRRFRRLVARLRRNLVSFPALPEQ